MQANFELLKEMKKRVMASGACVDSLIGVPPDSERFNNLLEVALQQQEMACIEMRRLYWQLKSKEETSTEIKPGKAKEIGNIRRNIRNARRVGTYKAERTAAPLQSNRRHAVCDRQYFKAFKFCGV